VRELRELFWAEAERNHVLPLLGGLTSFFGMVAPIPEESKFVFRGHIENVPSGMIPRIYNHSYTISADLVVPEAGAEGVIVAGADHLGGFSLFVQDGRLKHTYSMLGVLEYTQDKMDDALPPGSAGIIAIYEHDGAAAVGRVLTNAIRISTAQIDKVSADELKAGLKEASAGLAG